MIPSLQQRLAAAPDGAGPDQPVLRTPAGLLSRADALALGRAKQANKEGWASRFRAAMTKRKGEG